MAALINFISVLEAPVLWWSGREKGRGGSEKEVWVKNEYEKVEEGRSRETRRGRRQEEVAKEGE